jgi:hypothetical protein
MIGFVAVEGHTSPLRRVPSPFAGAAHQFGVRFDAKSDQIRECPNRISVSAGGFTVVCDQTQTFVANHSKDRITEKGNRLLKKSSEIADTQSKARMLPGLTTVSLPQTYCRACHLSTRSDVVRCLHCNRPLNPAPAALKRTRRKTKPARRIN